MATSHPMRGRRTGPNHTDLAYELRRTFGAWLKSVRETAELTQQEVTARLELGGGSALSGVELGRISMPPEWAERIIALYRLDSTEFGKRYLYSSNPWLYAVLYGADAKLRKLLRELPERKRR